MDSSADSSRSSCKPSIEAEHLQAPPVPLAGADWWRSQRHGLRRMGRPVLAIWALETIVLIAIAVLLAIR